MQGDFSTDIHVDSFPGCCGIQVISDFPSDEYIANAVADEQTAYEDEVAMLKEDAKYNGTRVSKDALAAVGKPGTEKDFLKQIAEDVEPHTKAAHGRLVLASLNGEQSKAAAVLVSQGFMPVGSFTNPGSGNTITVFAKGFATAKAAARKTKKATRKTAKRKIAKRKTTLRRR